MDGGKGAMLATVALGVDPTAPVSDRFGIEGGIAGEHIRSDIVERQRKIAKGHDIAAAAAAAPCFGALPIETLAEIFVRIDDARDICRCALASRRFANLIMHDPRYYIWRRSAIRRAREIGIEGPWLAAAVAVKGWMWLRRALDPLDVTGGGIGLLRRNTDTHFGEFRSGVKHGYVVSILPGKLWRHAEWIDGVGKGRNCTFYAFGDSYCGGWSNGLRHGPGHHIRAAGAMFLGDMHYRCTWRDGAPDGTLTISYNCRCGEPTTSEDGTGRSNVNGLDADPWGQTPATLNGAHGTVPHAPYGYIAQEEWRHGKRHGPVVMRHCNGDVFEHRAEHDILAGAARYVFSAHCPEPRFRSIEVVSQRWIHTRFRRSKGQGSHTFSHPDPVSSPDAFRIYRDYFEAGFLPVDERDRTVVSCLLAHASCSLPASAPDTP